MMERVPFRLKCDSIVYRKGFIEVTPAIHDGCVNIETWSIDADTSLGEVTWLYDPCLPDASVVANTEIELTSHQARRLAESLLAAAEVAEQYVKECDECGSSYFAVKSRMETLCPECAHHLYGYRNCDHDFTNGRCQHCHWNGSVADYIWTIKNAKE